MSKIGIIIPCYNEANQISILLKNLIDNHQYMSNDILVVDDGSVDDTVKIAESFNVNVLSLKINQGKGMAIYSGINFFNAHNNNAHNNIEGVIIIDGDNQHDPKYIKYFLEEFEKTKSNLIIGTRNFKSKEMPFPRKLSNTITSFLISKLVKQKIDDSQSGYRFLDREAMNIFEPKNLGFQAESEMIIQISKKGLKISSIPIKTIYLEDGRPSHINPIKDTLKFIKWYLGGK